MRKPKTTAPLPEHATDDQVARWATDHDVLDRLEQGTSEIVDDHGDLDRLLEDAVSQGNTAQLNMRVPPAMKAVLGALARRRTTDATTLARIWLAERLEQELRAR